MASMIVSMTIGIVGTAMEDMPDLMIALFIVTALPWLAAAVFWLMFGDSDKCDLYIYGMEDGMFLILNPLYEVMRQIAPGEIREIHIIPAMRPETRQKSLLKSRNDVTSFAVCGEKESPYPMAVLYTGEGDVDWSHAHMVEDVDWRYQHVPACRRALQEYLSIVPMGENALTFSWALQESACPVIVDGGTYKAHSEYLNSLFELSGMDMNRLTIGEEYQ